MLNPKFHNPVNVALSTLAISHTVGALTLVIKAEDGAKFGSPTPDEPIRVTVLRSSDKARTHYNMIGRTGGVLQWDTTLDGTEDQPFAVGDKVGVLVSAETIKELQQAITDTVTAVNTIQLTPGPQGNQGFVGTIGPQGSLGLQGTKGDTGVQGYQGASITGAAGSQGYQGAIGATGPMGSQGNQGSSVTGPQGSAGLNGFQGSQGYQGSTGSQGAAGVNGQQGASITGAQGSAGGMGTQGSQGPQGYQGFQGSGSQGPQGTGGSGATPGGSSGQIQFNNAGAFAGSTALSTTTSNPLNVSLNNVVYQTTSSANCRLVLDNPSSTAQTMLQFSRNGIPSGKVRNDYIGGMSYVAYQNAGHVFYVGGDAGATGSSTPLQVNSNGLLLSGAANSITMTAGGNNTITTSGSNLVMQQTGDQFGTTRLEVLNRGGANGARFSCSLWLVDFIFNSIQNNVQSNIRFNSDNTNLPGNTIAKGGQFLFFMNSGGSNANTYVAAQIGAGQSRFSSPTTFCPEMTAGVPLSVQPGTGQTADLTQWLGSTGNVASGVDKNGYHRSVVGSGAPTATPPDGSYYVDNTNKNLWVRIAGTWKNFGGGN